MSTLSQWYYMRYFFYLIQQKDIWGICVSSNPTLRNSILLQMLEGEPPMAAYEPYEAARYVSEGHRPLFKAKGYTSELRE